MSGPGPRSPRSARPQGQVRRVEAGAAATRPSLLGSGACVTVRYGSFGRFRVRREPVGPTLPTDAQALGGPPPLSPQRRRRPGPDRPPGRPDLGAPGRGRLVAAQGRADGLRGPVRDRPARVPRGDRPRCRRTARRSTSATCGCGPARPSTAGRSRATWTPGRFEACRRGRVAPQVRPPDHRPRDRPRPVGGSRRGAPPAQPRAGRVRGSPPPGPRPVVRLRGAPGPVEQRRAARRGERLRRFPPRRSGSLGPGASLRLTATWTGRRSQVYGSGATLGKERELPKVLPKSPPKVVNLPPELNAHASGSGLPGLAGNRDPPNTSARCTSKQA